MRVTLHSILKDCRAIYHLEGVMARYQSYVALMTGSNGEFLPLGSFSPMGQRQAAYLDALLELGAEDFAAHVGDEVCAELNELPDVYRLMLVVVDEPRNGWTQRFLTDADWRFSEKTDSLPKAARPQGFDRWVSVQLWTDVPVTPEYVRQETRAALYRAAYTWRHGFPHALEAMMRQEGNALRFAGSALNLEPDELAYTAAILEPLRSSTHYATNFAALYGDAAARSVGFEPLGLSANAGFALALERAVDPRLALLSSAWSADRFEATTCVYDTNVR